MESGKMVRLFHQMPTPEIPCRAGPLYLFGRTAPRRGMEEVIVCRSDFVSRRHCHIYFKNGAFWIKDLQSLNGTYLNEAKLLPQVERELRFGDKVGLGVSTSTTDLEPEDPSLYIFIFKKHEVEVIDIIDDDGQQPQSVRERSSSVEVLNEEENNPRPKKLLPPPPPPPRLRPEPESASSVPPLPHPAVASCSNSQAPFKTPLVSTTDQKVAEVGSNPVPPPIKSQASTPKSNSLRQPSPSHASTPSSTPTPPISAKLVPVSNRKPGPASSRIGSGNGSKISQPPSSNEFAKPKDHELPSKDQIIVPPPGNLQPEKNNAKKKFLAPSPPQGQKRKSSSTDDLSSGNNKKVPHQTKSTRCETPRVSTGEHRISTSPSPSCSGTAQIRRNPSIPGSVNSIVSTSNTNNKQKPRMSLDSSSGDDSSDGLQSSEAKILSNSTCRSSETQQSSAVADESRKLCLLTSDNPASHPLPPMPESGVNQLMPDPAEKMTDTVVLKLRQLIRLVGGTPAIRRCKFTILSDANREKIYKQWIASNKRCKAQANQNRYSDSGSESLSDSDSSEDCIVPLKKTKRDSSRHIETKPAPTDRSNGHKSTRGSSGKSPTHKATIKTKEVTTTESRSDHDVPKRTTVPKNKKEENQAQLSPNNQGLGSPEQLFSYSQPYASPDQALSPISSDDLNVNPGRNRIPSCSDVSEDGELHLLTSPTSSPTYNPSPPLPATISAEETKKPQSARKIMRIDDAPLPREFRKKNDALERGRHDQNITSTTSKPNLSIRERLKSIAEAKSSAPILDVPKPLSRAPVNIKTTTTNRSAELLSSMINSSNKSNKDGESVEHEKQSATSETKNKMAIRKPAIAAPRREIPLPSPTTQAQMPVNMIRSHMTIQHQQSTSRVGAMPPPKPVSHLLEQPVNRMEKHGVTLERQKSKKEVYDYGHKSTIPQQSAQGDASNSRGINHQLLEDDAGFKSVLKWRPAWLEEQKKVKGHPPPVTGDWEIVRTLLHYEDYMSYVLTFFPLMLLETWASVTQDYNTSRRRLQGRESNYITEFPVAVTNCQKTGVCPMIDVRWKDRVPKSRDRYYTVVDCLAIINHPNEIHQKRDLAICTFGTRCRDSSNPQEIVQRKREFFGYVLTSSHHTTPISDNYVIPQELRAKNPQAKHVFTFQVVVHSGDELDRSQLGNIQKIAYISPKLRDVKALVHLKHSKLHNAIIQTQPTKSIWNQHAVISQHHLVQHVTKLNSVQKSAVAYVTERVRSSDEELVLVHGPPGTGKTRTVVGMILQLLALKDYKGDKRLLICTPSNTALDEIMTRLEEAITDLPSTVTSGNKKIVMLRFGETEGSSMKKYSIEAHLRKIEDQNSMNFSIKKSIELCKTKISSKEAEIRTLEKNGGSKARLESLRRELEGIRNEHDAYSADLSKKRLEKTGSHTFEQKRAVLEKATVIFSTLNSCGNHVLTGTFGPRSGRKTKPFMCCIVDEASQTTEPETLAPLLLQIDKLVLVGDPHQLGATVLSQEAESRAFGQSMFSRLYEKTANRPQSVVMLTQQYRMHPEILTWPNEYFYKGMLKTQCIGRSADDECYRLKPYLFLNLSSQETSNGEGQISNEEEAKMVLGIMRNILLVLDSDANSAKKKFSIGVITPYSTQKNVIANDVKRELGSRADVEVDTVDSFQGKEKDIIIISCVRTDDTGFLKNPKRLNVALTRARHSLLIVGDADCLKKDNMWKSLIDNAKERKCLYNIPKSEWTVPGFLRKRLFQLLSPQKSQIPEDERMRDRL